MGATSDIGFEQYRDLYRRAYSKSSDREIGEGWMRGEAVVASGADYMMIHPAGETPSSPSDDDVFLSVNYGPQRFLARAAIRHLHMLINGWPSFVRQVREGIGKGMITDDARHDARGFIFDMVLDNRAQVDPTMAALTASAVAWLVTTSPVGEAFGNVHKIAHYQITDQASLAANGKRARNFRLALLNDLYELAKLKNLPSPPQW